MVRYLKYSDWLMSQYGKKIYKIPINLPGTCPNRDGMVGKGGCIFCGAVGTGFESQESSFDVLGQLERNIEYISPKYKADAYIAYFQNYTNTYLPVSRFKTLIESACIESVVGISVSTRPDCIGEPYLDALEKIRDQYGVSIEIELGLQSANEETLIKINRGHDVKTFVDAVKRVHSRGFSVCAHLIGNLPWDTEEDNLKAISLLKTLGVEAVKIHSLYILKNTVMGNMYLKGEIEIIDSDTYVDRLVTMVRHLPKDMVVQRLFGRAPEEDTLFCNWQMSWRKLQNDFEARLESIGASQGDLDMI